MGLISLFFENPGGFFLLLLLLLYSVIIHEVSHGFVALLFGDNTAKIYGRLTLNPLSHIDIFGMLMLLFVGFGWAKPVPINYYKLKNFRLGLFSVALAGCLSNLILATISIFLLETKFFFGFFAEILYILARINITLAVFNLLPIPPLDGSKVLFSILPERFHYKIAYLDYIGIFILIILLISGILDPIINIFNSIILKFILYILRFLNFGR